MRTTTTTASVTDLYYAIEGMLEQYLNRAACTDSKLAGLLLSVRREIEARLLPRSEAIIDYKDAFKSSVAPTHNRHQIKARIEHFNEIKADRKRFEIFPRTVDFWVGDTLDILEIEDGDFRRPTGREITGLLVTYVGLQGQGGTKPGYVALGFAPTQETKGIDSGPR